MLLSVSVLHVGLYFALITSPASRKKLIGIWLLVQSVSCQVTDAYNQMPGWKQKLRTRIYDIILSLFHFMWLLYCFNYRSMGVVLYELCNLQHAFEGEVSFDSAGSLCQRKTFTCATPPYSLVWLTWSSCNHIALEALKSLPNNIGRK